VGKGRCELDEECGERKEKGKGKERREEKKMRECPHPIENQYLIANVP
jgi:hypothetical protein